MADSHRKPFSFHEDFSYLLWGTYHINHNVTHKIILGATKQPCKVAPSKTISRKCHRHYVVKAAKPVNETKNREITAQF